MHRVISTTMIFLTNLKILYKRFIFWSSFKITKVSAKHSMNKEFGNLTFDLLAIFMFKNNFCLSDSSSNIILVSGHAYHFFSLKIVHIILLLNKYFSSHMAFVQRESAIQNYLFLIVLFT